MQLEGDLLKNSLWARAVLEERGKFIVKLSGSLLLNVLVVLDANFNQIGAINCESNFTVLYHPPYKGKYMRQDASLKLYPKYCFH